MVRESNSSGDKMNLVSKLESVSFFKYFRVPLHKDANVFKFRREKRFNRLFKSEISLGLNFSDFSNEVFTVRDNRSVLVQLPYVTILGIQVHREHTTVDSIIIEEASDEDEDSILSALAYELAIRSLEMDDCYAQAQDVIRRMFVSMLNSLGFRDIQIVFPKEKHYRIFPDADKSKDVSNSYFLAIDPNGKQYIQYKNGTKVDFPAGVVSWRDKILFADKYQ